MSNGIRRRPDLDPEEIYNYLGPITDTEHRYLTHMSPGERNRWFANIYGQTTARYARTIWQAHARSHPR